MKRLLTVSLLVLVLSLSLTACGSKGATINVTLKDFSYSPTSFTVSPGEQVTINAHNEGSAEHEFAIMKKGDTVAPPFGEKDEGNIFWELDAIEPGTTKSATFTAPNEPGDYEVICGLPGHIEHGMVGDLIVK